MRSDSGPLHGHPGATRAQGEPLRLEVEQPPRMAAIPRDRPVDVLRGLAIVLMITSHVGARSRVNTLLHLPLWIFALGLFVGLSGFVVGLRARTAVDWRGFVRRAGELWVLHCVFTLAVIHYHHLTGRLAAPDIADLGGYVPALIGVLLLYVQPLDYMNILPLFIVFFLMAPLVATCLRRGWTAACLALSIALWATSQVYPHWSRYTHPTSWPELGSLAAWQLAFVLGVVLGFERTRLFAWLGRAQHALVGIAAGSVAIIFVLAQFQRTALQRFGLHLPQQWQWLVSKSELGPLALIYMLGLLYLGYRGLAWLARCRPRAFVRFQPLEVLGGRSLYAFIIHLPLALAASAVDLNHLPGWLQEVSAVSALALVYLCARYHVLGRFIPA